MRPIRHSADHGVLVESPIFGGNERKIKDVTAYGYISPVRPKVGEWSALLAPRAQQGGS
jgi:hypothetical protein